MNIVEAVKKYGGKKPSFLLPSGIGDIHWCLLLLRGVLRAAGYDDDIKPDIYVVTTDARRNRAGGFVEMVPWVDFQGYMMMTHLQNVIAHVTQGGQIMANFGGITAFWAVNKQIEDGTPMEDIIPGMRDVDWDYQVDMPKQRFEHPRPFVEMAWFSHGFYKPWWEFNPPTEIVRYFLDHDDELDIVLTGAHWDVDDMAKIEAVGKDRILNMSGKTTIEELFAIKHASRGFIGYPSGSGIMSQHFNKPSVMLWGPHNVREWHKDMPRCWAKPSMENDYVDLPHHFAPVSVLEAWDYATGG